MKTGTHCDEILPANCLLMIILLIHLQTAAGIERLRRPSDREMQLTLYDTTTVLQPMIVY
jgi:hypothetical protein